MGNKLFEAVKKTASKAGAKMKKHSPEIFIVAGIAGIVVSAVTACIATTKVDSIVTETKEKIEKINSCAENKDIEEYTEEDAKKDIAIVYVQTGWKFVKLYAPSVILGALSIASIIKSNDILRKRNMALAAAYSTVDKGFKEYRKRVKERFGEEVDHELRYNIKPKKTEEVVTDENGNDITIEKAAKVCGYDGISEYARFFDECSEYWEKDSEYNLMFVRKQQNYANDLLVSRGYLFLNEVYALLGLEMTKAGQIVGWVYDKDNPVGDNYVDFGIYDIDRESNRKFVNGIERVILLDFNVDGNILDRI